ncbi:hypothetical protein PF008_g24243 [Phytophthora fragariae]|uniref:Secreted protein n=1 Tax=Phytophthora fragariae TaxID=53985 RepID=A0A6G0QND6_9STRA|nr:hypothetical protein PF008_g24243 [Phytophthora fragariae]
MRQCYSISLLSLLFWGLLRTFCWLIPTARTRVTGQRVVPLGDTGRLPQDAHCTNGGPVRATWFIDDT